MHVCDEFRERISERMLDHADLDKDLETQRELLVCNHCADFYVESREMLEAISAVRFEVSEGEWDDMADRMQARIRQDQSARPRAFWQQWLYLPAFAAAVAMLLLAVGIRSFFTPSSSGNAATNSAGLRPDTVFSPLDPSVDPVTAEYLQESELLLRSVMKLKSSSVDDLEDARRMARHQLVALDQRKQAVSAVKPLVSVMNKYETVLRDIRNLDSRPRPDDIADIKNRIEKNELISNMTAFQPRPVVIEAGAGMEK